MKRLFLLCVFGAFISTSFGQKIQGVFVGKIFSEENAIILETDSKHVSGAVYVSEKNRYNFIGTYDKPQLRGAILLDSSKKISVEGSLKGSTLSLTFPDSSEIGIRTVHKVSTKVAVDLADLFSKRHDMLLLGEWETFKSIDPSGNVISTGGEIHDYGLGGKGLGRFSGSIQPPVNRNRNYSPGVVGAAKSTRFQINWGTQDGTLDETLYFPFQDPRSSSDELNVHRTLSYLIKNDTLVTKSGVGYIGFWKRLK